jgi:hypothetical protein
MPFYRIVIFTLTAKKQGIRWIDNASISAVQGIMQHKAREMYRGDLKEVEVQMLSKTCMAVKRYIKAEARKIELKKHPPSKTPPGGGYNPRKNPEIKRHWGQEQVRAGLEEQAKAAEKNKGNTTGN